MKLKIDDLRLSLDNPRLEDSGLEQEEIEKMLDNQGNKIVNLAKDICIHGLSPLDIIAVYPSDSEEGKYTVVEGNRRATTLKLLHNPYLINSDLYPFIYSAFVKLHSSTNDLSDSIECKLFDSKDDDELLHWIEIKHLGENEGKGTSNWSPIQKSRWNRKRLGVDPLLDFWDELAKLNILTQDEVQRISKTNWERILSNYGLEFLEIRKHSDKYILPNDLVLFTNKIKIIHQKLQGQSVGIVYDKEKIKEFYDSISIELYQHPQSRQEQLKIESPISPCLVDEATALEGDRFSQTSNIPEINKTVITPVQIKPLNDPFNGCNTVIPKRLPIRSSNIRINQLINELKDTPVTTSPNMCGSALRLLFELSAKLYLEQFDSSDQTELDFSPALHKASRTLMDKKLINKMEKKAIDQDVENLRLLFNGYMHNTDSYPSSETIQNKFKAHHKFIMILLGIQWPYK